MAKRKVRLAKLDIFAEKGGRGPVKRSKGVPFAMPSLNYPVN
jgi:hypothetical protein